MCKSVKIANPTNYNLLVVQVLKTCKFRVYSLMSLLMEMQSNKRYVHFYVYIFPACDTLCIIVAFSYTTLDTICQSHWHKSKCAHILFICISVSDDIQINEQYKSIDTGLPLCVHPEFDMFRNQRSPEK